MPLLPLMPLMTINGVLPLMQLMPLMKINVYQDVVFLNDVPYGGIAVDVPRLGAAVRALGKLDVHGVCGVMPLERHENTVNIDSSVENLT